MWYFKWHNASLKMTFTQRGYDLAELEREQKKLIAGGHKILTGILPIFEE